MNAQNRINGRKKCWFLQTDHTQVHMFTIGKTVIKSLNTMKINKKLNKLTQVGPTGRKKKKRMKQEYKIKY